jgi:hypothetical protein
MPPAHAKPQFRHKTNEKEGVFYASARELPAFQCDGTEKPHQHKGSIIEKSL